MIPGTRVPDNALHRASLWLEDFKSTRDGKVKAVDQDTMVVEFDQLIAACGLTGVTGSDLFEGCIFYGDNFADSMFGRIGLIVTTQAGPATINDVLRSVWMDGLMHGIATRDGKRGLSNTEIEEGVGRDESR